MNTQQSSLNYQTPSVNNSLNRGCSSCSSYNPSCQSCSRLNSGSGLSNAGLNSNQYQTPSVNNAGFNNYSKCQSCPSYSSSCQSCSSMNRGLNNQYQTTAVPLTTGAVPYSSGLGAPSTIVTPTGATFASGDTAPPSSLKGNITAFVGKMQHDPVKQHAGNAMVASSKEAKASRFEAKAIEWERKGNVQKAQKNRGKAALYRQRAIAKLNQPCVTAYPPGVKNDKAARCELKALEYEKKGNLAKAQRNREKAYRIREKYGIAHPVGTRPFQTTTTTLPVN